MNQDLENRAWWGYLEEDLQELLKEAVILTQKVGDWDQAFHDYAFVVFPAAKAYEGFLKKLFLDLKFISRQDYVGKRFRVGKALNPSLKGKLGDKGVYEKLVEFYGGPGLADKLWETWRKGRNLTFHWFPGEKNAITFEEAKIRVEAIISSIDEAFAAKTRA